MNSPKTIHEQIASEFAKELAGGNFEKANSFLSDTATANLEQEYNDMIEYGDGPATLVEVMSQMEDWPAKTKDDIGWVYVALAGEGFSEAVTVIVSRVEGELKITTIEWGRP